MKKLRNPRGETLVETLAATLIFTIGSMIMLTLISSGAKINDAARRADEKYYTDMAIVEKAEFAADTTPAATVTFRFQDSCTPILEDTANVYISGDPENGLYAYYPVQGGGGS